MKQKVYGAYNMTEWEILLPVAGRIMKIPFSGGTISGTGIRPAAFTTQNEIIQFALENSLHFKSGRVQLIDETDIEDPKAESEEAQETSTDNEDVADNFTEVEVGSLEEAVDYLVSNFDDANKQQLRSKKAANAFAETKNIRFVGL
ncbi:hypothetical protein [Prevotella intermedia]|uniref:Uncharacterized protein n=1 Tax=Prevotella intermedia TaxID=28131 RepID=A0A2G9ICV1_PREIN|nr:hypothetical protein [Prevotella intermedia]PIN27592.1 hypothetical protein CUC04_09525 [Prevotella intermedia]